MVAFTQQYNMARFKLHSDIYKFNSCSLHVQFEYPFKLYKNKFSFKYILKSLSSKFQVWIIVSSNLIYVQNYKMKGEYLEFASYLEKK